jgi:hypothetical protein
VVRYVGTGLIRDEFRSPFQSPQYTGISVNTLDLDGDGLADAVLLTAHKGKRIFRRIFAG